MLGEGEVREEVPEGGEEGTEEVGK